MAVNDIHEARLIFTNAITGKNIQTHVQAREDNALLYSAQAFRDEIIAWWETQLGGAAAQRSQHPAEIALARIVVQRIAPTLGLASEFTISPASPGTHAGDGYLASDAPVISIRTNLAGRRNRGRMYLPPVAEPEVDSGVWESVRAQETADQFQAWIAGFSANLGATHGVYSRVGASFTPSTAILVDRRLRSQRRRQLRAPQYVT